MQGDYYLSIYFTWEMPRAAIIHLPRHNTGARIIGEMKRRGEHTKKCPSYFLFRLIPKTTFLIRACGPPF